MSMRHYLQQRIRSFGYAFKGVYVLVRDTANARIHLLATVVVVGLGLALELGWTEWALLALAMGMVWAAEAFNSALETLTDLSSPGRHPLAGKAKDLAAGAVLLAAIFAVVVAACVFLPKLF